jgi:sugar lactone lactonase YvrE
MRKLRRLVLVGTLLATACGGDDAPADCSDEPGTACTWAGVAAHAGFNGDGKPRQESWLYWPMDVTFAPDGRPWIVDWQSHRIRVVETDGTLQTMVGNDVEGDGAPDDSDLLPLGDPPGAPGPEVSLNHPAEIEFLPDGNAVIAAWHNLKIRTLDVETGIVKTLAGRGYGSTGDDGPAALALFNLPKAIELAPDGTMYVLDQKNYRIRVIAPDGERIITTTVGTGTHGYSGDGGPAIDAELAFSSESATPAGGLALRGQDLYIADSQNNRIRHVDLTTGVIECIAGDGVARHAGDGGPAIDASLFGPNDLEFGPDGRLYVADAGNMVVRAIDLETGIIEHVAGTGEPCPPPDACVEAEEGLPAAEVKLNLPYGIEFDAAGNLYVADTFNNRIVRIAR